MLYRGFSYNITDGNIGSTSVGSFVGERAIVGTLETSPGSDHGWILRNHNRYRMKLSSGATQVKLCSILLFSHLVFAQGQIPTTTWVQGQGYSNIPTGMIGLVISGSCPSGWTEVSALNGKFLAGTLNANGNVGTTGGNATITPSGTIQQATFTGSSGTTSAVSAGTPAGTNGTTTTGATSAGTPAGTISAIAATATAAVAVSTGSGNSMATNAHTHPAPTFTGSALATHTHTVPAEVFTGSALPTHTHTLTPAGTINAQAFTGTAVDPSPPFVRVIFCQKN